MEDTEVAVSLHLVLAPIPPRLRSSPCIPDQRTYGAYAQRAGDPQSS